jgi:hypothetical protein
VKAIREIPLTNSIDIELDPSEKLLKNTLILIYFERVNKLNTVLRRRNLYVGGG